MTLGTRIITTLIVASALLSACVSQSTYNQEVQKASTLSAQDQAYQKLTAQLKGEVAADQAQISQLQNVVRVTLANGILFPEGGWELNDAGKQTLAKLAPVLKTLTGQKIEVKGFTDNVPIGPELRARFPSNVELSRARAQSVAELLVAQGVPASIMSTSGLGDAQPVAPNDTAQGRAKNRRVVIDIVEVKS
jgi:chemotaxis protein MotB